MHNLPPHLPRLASVLSLLRRNTDTRRPSGCIAPHLGMAHLPLVSTFLLGSGNRTPPRVVQPRICTFVAPLLAPLFPLPPFQAHSALFVPVARLYLSGCKP